jgi:hypothetical protein
MSRAESRKILLLGLWSSFFFLWTVGTVFAESSTNPSWQTLDTKYTAIHYHSLKDLKSFNSNIDFSISSMGLKWLFKKKTQSDIENEIRLKVDAVYERVQEILDMRKSMKKVTIYLSHDKKELYSLYQNIFRRPCQLRAWYVYELNSVYVNADDIHEGILAHEMAHFIIDHYLLIRPPEATAEILARYVDGHLFD